MATQARIRHSHLDTLANDLKKIAKISGHCKLGDVPQFLGLPLCSQDVIGP